MISMTFKKNLVIPPNVSQDQQEKSPPWPLVPVNPAAFNWCNWTKSGSCPKSRVVASCSNCEERSPGWVYITNPNNALLLMEEILHLSIGSLSHHLQGFAPFPGGDRDFWTTSRIFRANPSTLPGPQLSIKFHPTKMGGHTWIRA